MKTQSLAESNPYLKDHKTMMTALVRTVESSTAIEGVHLKLSDLKVKPSMKKSSSRISAKSSR